MCDRGAMKHITDALLCELSYSQHLPVFDHKAERESGMDSKSFIYEKILVLVNY